MKFNEDTYVSILYNTHMPNIMLEVSVPLWEDRDANIDLDSYGLFNLWNKWLYEYDKASSDLFYYKDNAFRLSRLNTLLFSVDKLTLIQISETTTHKKYLYGTHIKTGKLKPLCMFKVKSRRAIAVV